MTNTVPIREKINLTVQEASQLFSVGTHKIRELSRNGDCDFTVSIGAKLLINKERFNDYLLRHQEF